MTSDEAAALGLVYDASTQSYLDPRTPEGAAYLAGLREGGGMGVTPMPRSRGARALFAASPRPLFFRADKSEIGALDPAQVVAEIERKQKEEA